MQKYSQDNGAVGVENLNRWPSDSDAVTFLSDTTSDVSAREMRGVHSPPRLRVAGCELRAELGSVSWGL